jgi:hypothetical protein
MSAVSSDIASAGEHRFSRLGERAKRTGYNRRSHGQHLRGHTPVGGFDAAGVDAEFFPDSRFHSVLVANIGCPGKTPGLPASPGSASTKRRRGPE